MIGCEPTKALRCPSALRAYVAAVSTVLLLGSTLIVSSIAGATADPGSRTLAPMVAASSPHNSLPSGGTRNSINWAGYADSGSTFTSVAGSWSEPSARCSGTKAQQAAFWVGIDGYSASDRTVQQIGTDTDCSKGKGKKAGTPSYYAWFEMYPAAIVPLSQSSYPVTPGDALSASVATYGSDYVLRLTDFGKWTFTTLQASSLVPTNSSAEWIAEAPSSCNGAKCKVVPLTDFGSVSFSGATVNGAAVSSFAQERLNMTNKSGKQVKAFPSSLTAGGTAFSVDWLHV